VLLTSTCREGVAPTVVLCVQQNLSVIKRRDDELRSDAEAREKRGYKFKPSDSRVLEEQALERQLKAAAFLPTTKADKDAYSLSEGERRGPPTFRSRRLE
jgi:hypothetical protein